MYSSMIYYIPSSGWVIDSLCLSWRPFFFSCVHKQTDSRCYCYLQILSYFLVTCLRQIARDFLVISFIMYPYCHYVFFYVCTLRDIYNNFADYLFGYCRTCIECEDKGKQCYFIDGEVKSVTIDTFNFCKRMNKFTLAGCRKNIDLPLWYTCICFKNCGHFTWFRLNVSIILSVLLHPAVINKELKTHPLSRFHNFLQPQLHSNYLFSPDLWCRDVHLFGYLNLTVRSTNPHSQFHAQLLSLYRSNVTWQN